MLLASSVSLVVGCGASCPATPTKLPFARLSADSKSHVECQVDTEVALEGPADPRLLGYGIGHPAFLEDDDAVFSVTDPGGQSGRAAIVVKKTAAGPIYSLKGGTKLAVAGEVRIWEANYFRTFILTSSYKVLDSGQGVAAKEPSTKQ